MIVVQSSTNHNWSCGTCDIYALDNPPTQGTTKCQETCRMATDAINLLHAARTRVGIANERAPKRSKMFVHFLRC